MQRLVAVELRTGGAARPRRLLALGDVAADALDADRDARRSSITRLDTSRITEWPSLAMNSCSKVVPRASPESLRSVVAQRRDSCASAVM